ncbi:MAG TPA: hypothetical protein VMV94_10710, partial [Phycisphaerae bacterium]|nr:hypothetical protein [Phycisphaerae bacterium]
MGAMAGCNGTDLPSVDPPHSGVVGTASGPQRESEGAGTSFGAEYAVGPRTPQWPLKASRVLYNDAQIAAARQLCDTDSGAMAIKNRIVQQAAYWMAIPDEELFLRLPDSSVPRAFDVSESGCPVHG